MTAKVVPFKEIEPKCSFCHKPKSQVKRLISGANNAHICGECLKIATKRKDES